MCERCQPREAFSAHPTNAQPAPNYPSSPHNAGYGDQNTHTHMHTHTHTHTHTHVLASPSVSILVSFAAHLSSLRPRSGEMNHIATATTPPGVTEPPPPHTAQPDPFQLCCLTGGVCLRVIMCVCVCVCFFVFVFVCIFRCVFLCVSLCVRVSVCFQSFLVPQCCFRATR